LLHDGLKTHAAGVEYIKTPTSQHISKQVPLPTESPAHSGPSS
jgi:hypothetical protein